MYICMLKSGPRLRYRATGAALAAIAQAGWADRVGALETQGSFKNLAVGRNPMVVHCSSLLPFTALTSLARCDLVGRISDGLVALPRLLDLSLMYPGSQDGSGVGVVGDLDPLSRLVSLTKFEFYRKCYLDPGPHANVAKFEIFTTLTRLSHLSLNVGYLLQYPVPPSVSVLTRLTHLHIERHLPEAPCDSIQSVLTLLDTPFVCNVRFKPAKTTLTATR